MEVSVSFTDGQSAPADAGCIRQVETRDSDESRDSGSPYIIEETVLGKVWIRKGALILSPPVRIRYEKHPWIEAFEFDGVKAAPAKRTGIGTKNAKGFVKSLSTIYSQAYDEYRRFGGDADFDADGYFRHAAEHFASLADDPGKARMYSKFCGFTENMWREGDRQMLDICIGTVIPVLEESDEACRLFHESITGEFREYLSGNRAAG